ncbi:MAG: hypothetical protein IPL61_08715 [Myxococcales bacterium]|nr:hypothetical protein [Myxococcales bacterium]
MTIDERRRRAGFLEQYRWALAFAIAIATTFVALPPRPLSAGLAYDLIPAGALGAVWLATGLALGIVARRWARVAEDEALPTARTLR